MASVTPEKPSAVDVLHCVRTSPLGNKLQRMVAEVWKVSVLLSLHWTESSHCRQKGSLGPLGWDP